MINYINANRIGSIHIMEINEIKNLNEFESLNYALKCSHISVPVTFSFIYIYTVYTFYVKVFNIRYQYQCCNPSLLILNDIHIYITRAGSVRQSCVLAQGSSVQFNTGKCQHKVKKTLQLLGDITIILTTRQIVCKNVNIYLFKM